MALKNFFWENLSPYFHQLDTYKDANNQGLLERYLSNFGTELDEEVVPFIENFMQILDPQYSQGKFLGHIAYQLGNPPDIFINPSLYQNLFYKIIHIYKTKGLVVSYKYALWLIELIGYIEEIQELLLYTDDGKYTDEQNYTDFGTTGNGTYRLRVQNLDGSAIPSIDSELLAKINVIRSLVEPEHMTCIEIYSAASEDAEGFNYILNFNL